MRNDTRIPPRRKLTGCRCRCGACGEHFNSVTAFDLHRAGTFEARRCLAPAEMVAFGMSSTVAGFWITETREQRELRRGGVGQTHRGGDRHGPAPTARAAA